MQPTEKPKTENKALLNKQNRAKQRLSQIAEYFERRAQKDDKKPLAKMTDINDYKATYTPLDISLSNIVENLANDFHSQKAYHFGYEKPNFAYGAGSKLVKEPCLCSGERALSIQDKRDLRAQAESYVTAWQTAAKNWLHNGGNELQGAEIKQQANRSAKPTMVQRPSVKIIKKLQK